MKTDSKLQDKDVFHWVSGFLDGTSTVILRIEEQENSRCVWLDLDLMSADRSDHPVKRKAA